MQPDSDPLPAEKAAVAQHLIFDFRIKPQLAHRIVDTVYSETGKHGLPASLVLAIIATESGFNASATSRMGACGLMQVLPRYHTGLMRQLTHGNDIYFPENNIRVGTAILVRYLTLADGDVDTALHNYSGGSHGYLQRVRTRWQEFAGLAKASASKLPADGAAPVQAPGPSPTSLQIAQAQ